jgi:hypothetical protein
MFLLLLLGNIFYILKNWCKGIITLHLIGFIDALLTINVNLAKNTTTKSKIPFVLCTFYYEIMMKHLYFCDLFNKMQHSFYICTTKQVFKFKTIKSSHSPIEMVQQIRHIEDTKCLR